MFQKTEIRSKEGILHFRRWRILETKFFRLFLHQIFETDKDLHGHSHPWHFVSWVLKGGYVERLSDGSHKHVEKFGFNWHKATDYHKIVYLCANPTVSLFLAFGEYRPWGYETSEGHIDSAEYRERKHADTLPSS